MKNRITAALIALFLGSFGAHKFYLRDSGAGIFYLILFMVGSSMRLPISAFLGFVDALVLFSMTDEKFDAKYNKQYDSRADRRGQRRDRRYDARQQRRYDTRETYGNRRQQGSYEARRQTYRKPPEPENKVRRPRENPFKKTGISKYKEYDIDGAIEDFNKGLELDPTDMALHFNLAAAYSLTEQTEKGFYHLEKAVENGFKDFEKIKTHDDLAFLRIQEDFESFQENGYKRSSTSKVAIDNTAPAQETEDEVPDVLIQDDILLSQLQKLSELRNKGLLSEKEYSLEKEKLMRR
jgi:TM2 domain-containing membrane protein YozV